MTLPSLIANHRDKKTVAQLKKAYSTLQQAYLMAISKHGEPENWGMGKTVTTTNDDGTTQTDYSQVEIFWQYMSENMNTINTDDNLLQYDRYSLDGIKRTTVQIKKSRI